MICVDTSVWVDFFRGRDQRLVAELGRVMDECEVLVAAPVRVELLSGARRSELSKLRRLLSAFATLEPGAQTWQLVDGWIDRAVAAGQRFGSADLLIAALAAEQRAELWSLDGDFARMERLGFVRRHAWARG